MFKNKKNYIGRIAGIALSGIVGLTLLGGQTVSDKNINVQAACTSHCQKNEETIYRTLMGKCYHKDPNCQYLKKSRIITTQDDIKKHNLKPCSKCCH